MKLFEVAILGMLLASAAILPAQTRSPAHQLQEAIDLMETRGDYAAALPLLEEVGRGPDRALAARALLYSGQCYEKLGKEKAKQAYQRIIREFADQREVVAEARKRLSALGPAPGTADKSAPAVRRVWEDADFVGAASPDGRYVSFVDRETGDLAVHDLASGQSRRLTNMGPGTDVCGRAGASTFSPDGKQIAYGCIAFDLGSQERHLEVRIIPVEADGAKPRILYRDESQEVILLDPADWSPDGKQILALARGKDGAHQIVLISVADGSRRVLKTLDWRYPQKMAFSPDGRYIAYDFPPEQDSAQRDIFLLASDGSREIPLVQHPADDVLLGWAPDGKRLIFASDRGDSWGAWAIRGADGKPEGTPELIKGDLGRIRPLGFTRNGSYYYSLLTEMSYVYVVSLDPKTGKALAPPVPVTAAFSGSHFDPEWSPDGKYLASVSGLPAGPTALGHPVLRILSLETGEKREVFPKLKNFWRLHWSPNGRFLLATGIDQNNRGGVYQIDVQTGEVTTLVRSAPNQFYPYEAAWSADGKSVFYSYRGGPILRRNLETGEDKEIYHAVVFAVSPDGRWLAVRESTEMGILKVVPAGGGEARELFRPDGDHAALTTNLAWSADGRYVLFGRGRPVPQGTIELWRIPVEGGEPQRLDLSARGMIDLRAHPDGQRIAFDSVGTWKSELWVMENFLNGREAGSSVGSARK